nr:hypothetical protein [uncultured Psychroserpens sp.]
MKNCLKLFFTSILLSLVLNCDRPGKISVKNNSDQTITYKYYSKSNDTVTLKVPPNEKRYVMFGFGKTWDDKEFKTYLNDIEALYIIHDKDTSIYKSKQMITSYFLKRLKTITKREVLIIEQ